MKASDQKTVRRTDFRERVMLHYSYAHAAASEAGGFEIMKGMLPAPV